MRFEIYSCPLPAAASSWLYGCSYKKRRKRGGLRTRWTYPYMPYGIMHAFVKIGDDCYHYGKYGRSDYAFHGSCWSRSSRCCWRWSGSAVYTGYTSCPEKARDVQDIWNNSDTPYSLLSKNCQLYANVLKSVLNSCSNLYSSWYTACVKK